MDNPEKLPIQWPKEGQTIQWPKEGQTIQWPKEGQIIQWSKEKEQTMICKTLQKTQKIEHHESLKNTGRISSALEE